MLRYVSFFALLTLSLSSFSQTPEFEKTFNDGILHLGNNKLAAAAISFEELYKQDTTNANVSYLLGQCYARRGVKLTKAIRLLNQSLRAYSPEYKKRDPSERRTSEYAFYYLLMAYSFNGDCELTLETLNNFYRNYSYENEWYLVDAQRLHRDCVQRNIPVVQKEVEVVQEKPSKTPEEIEPYKPNKRHIIGTKQIQYTDKTAAWGVQVGAFLEPVFTYEFKGLRNIEVYVDNNGIYRYVIGRFVFESQAEKLLDLILEEGYEDAFITNVKDMQKFSEEVITIDNESIHKELVGRVDYRVQVGAFRGDTVPEHLMQIYLQLDSISQAQYGELTLMTVGSFDSYEAADFYKELVQDLGVTDAFVTAWNYKRRVELKHAKVYLEEQARMLEERERLESEDLDKTDSKKKKRK